MNTKSSNKRLLFIDIGKSISILGVVGIHALSQNDPEWINYFTTYFRFWVPLFIISSFYLLEINNGNKKVTFDLMLSRIIRLIIPLVFWSTFYYFILHQQKNNNIFNLIGYFTITGWTGQYYLALMIQLTIIYPVIRLIRLTHLKTLLLSFLIMIIIYIPFSYLQISPILNKVTFTPFFYSIPYVLIGISFARLDNHLAKNNSVDINRTFVF